jgi:hypothetical protein
LSGVTDPATKETHFGQNFTRGELRSQVFEDFKANAHPLVQKRLAIHDQKVKNGELKAENPSSISRAGEPGGHSEVRALDAALKAFEEKSKRPATENDLASFLLHNQSFENPGGVPPRCAHCWHITDGVTVIGND